jgi:hypothetical protein
VTPRWVVRVVGKALALFVLFDFFQAGLRLDRRLEGLSLYRFLVPPLARIDSPRDYPTPVAWRMEPLLDAHRIGRPRAAGELRVAVLGDSGTFGYFSPAATAVPGQMTALGRSIGGRRVVAYNLAYQTPNSLKDLLIERHAVKRGVDAVVWFVTLYDLARDAPSPYRPDVHLLLRVNADELPELSRNYGVDTWETRLLSRPETGVFRRSILVAGGRYRDLALLWSRSLLDAMVPDDPSDSAMPARPWIGSEPLPREALFGDLGPNDPPMPNSRWKNLEAGARIAREAGARLLIVNDPIFIAPGPESGHEYNGFYEKTIFDRYRSTLARFCAERGIELLDLWDAVPPEEYGNTPQHYLPAGNARIARAIVDRLEALR